MRRLEHLPGVLRVVVGVVILHAFCDRLQYLCSRISVEIRRKVRQVLVALGEFCQCVLQEFEFGGIDHRLLWELLRRGAYRNISVWT